MPADGPQERWVPVAEAVLYCAERGLVRTAKTVRKWASRSVARPDQAEIRVRHEDTGNGFRWVIEQGSLDRKIEEELAFEVRRSTEPVGTAPEPSAPVQTGALMPGNADPDAHRSEPVETGAETGAAMRGGSGTLSDFLQEQLAEKDRQIAKLNEQIERKDAQIMTMLERDRETNLLINGLQQTLTHSLGLEAPGARRPAPSSPEGEAPRRSIFHPRGVE